MFESFLVAQGVVANAGAIVVDGGEGIIEELGDLGAVGFAHANEREDAEFGGEELALLGKDGCLGLEQGIELLDKIRIEGEEQLVEIGVELLEFFLDEVGGLEFSGEFF